MLKHSRAFALLGMAIVLSGCLSTERPAFTEANSVQVWDSPEFLEFARLSKEIMGEDLREDADLNGPHVRVVAKGTFLILQAYGEGEDSATYYGLMYAGGRVFTCMPSRWGAVAKFAEERGLTSRFGKTISGAQSSEDSSRIYDGPDEAVFDFVLEVFATQDLECETGG